MDAKDYQIIKELQRDGRLTNQELSERVNLSPSPCLRRVRNLEKAGILKGYSAVVDERAFGLGMTAFVRITLERHSGASASAFEDGVQRIDEVLDCYVMAGGTDYLLRVLVPDLQSYERFIRNRLHKIEGIASIDTGFAYGVVKQAQVFPDIQR